MRCSLLVLLPLLLLLSPLAVANERTPCQQDVDFALAALEEKCGHFFKLKGIDWKKVSKQFRKEAAKVDTPGEHHRLRVRPTARLKDGHASARKTGKGESIEWPEPIPERLSGPGLFLAASARRCM